MAIVYFNGGDFVGEHEDRKLSKWKEYGIEHKQLWLYKGYRYFMNKKDVVCVFSVEPFDEKEIVWRRHNGFLGIKEYYLGEN